MSGLLSMKSWSPYAVGVGIGMLSWFAFATAGQPLGVSTAFEHSAALALKAAAPAAEESNEYFAKKAEEGKPPKIGWEWMLVLGAFLGAALSAWLSGDGRTTSVPEAWRERFGGGALPRLAAAFFAGALMMLGARMASGCTSGHGISGNLQLAVSSLVFTATFFAAAIATSFALYGQREGARV